MIANNLKSIIFLLIGLIFMFLLMKNCSGNRSDNTTDINTPEKSVQVVLTTKLDTLYVKKYVHDTVYIKSPSLVKSDTIFVEGTKTAQVIPKVKRVYSDTIHPVDSVQVKYTANVTGTLDDIKLDYKDWRAERTLVKTNTITTTITNNIKPKGLYVGIGANLGLTQLAPCLEYLNNKNKFGVYYNVATTTQGIQNIGLTYSRKLF